MQYRLGIDLGATSLGWCVLKLENGEPVEVERMGVRIFDDGRDAKSKEPLAVTRRDARGMRRRRDRMKTRQENLIEYLTEIGLMPKDREERKKLAVLDPYALRAKALDKKLEAFELGRALFHIGQRRGFKSNRKENTKATEGNMLKAMQDLEKKLAEAKARSLGEYFNNLKINGEHVRVSVTQEGAKTSYSLYPRREMYQAEVDLILSKQKEFHSALSDAAQTKIKHILFHQRPLKKPEVGKCTFEGDEKRAHLALPSVQYFRIIQEVNNLAIVSYSGSPISLTEEQKVDLINELGNRKEFLFEKIRKHLKLNSETRFNLESHVREKLKGNETQHKLMHKDAFGENWIKFKLSEQDEIVKYLLDEDDENKLIKKLEEKYKLPQENAEYISRIDFKNSYGRLSLKAIQKLLPLLKNGLLYHEACKKVYGTHVKSSLNEVASHLDYYGKLLPHRVIGGKENAKIEDVERYYGKVNNPTVHIGLNQIRKLVNTCIEEYGNPTQVVVELARDLKMSFEQKRNFEKAQKINQDRNDRISTELEALGIENNYENRFRFKLWEDLNEHDPKKRCCVFTGKIITPTQLFSDAIEIEHLVPFSICFDDGFNNKTVCFRQANRDKGNRTPYEAFGTSPKGYNWEEIAQRASTLAFSKRWRFQPNARERVENVRQDSGFKTDPIARQLSDTQYLSKLAKEYLEFICPANQVYGIPGRLTAWMRQHWGLNKILNHEDVKNRGDHRHHAIDAFVVACTSRGTLQKLSRAAGLAEEKQTKLEKIPLPYEGFKRPDFQKVVDQIVISHKPDHGGAFKAIHAKNPYTTGKLHDETAFGYWKKCGTVEKKQVLAQIEGIEPRLGEFFEERLGETLTFKDKLSAIIKKSTLNQKKKEKLLGLAEECAYGENGKSFYVRRIAVKDLRPQDAPYIVDKKYRNEIQKLAEKFENEKTFKEQMQKWSEKNKIYRFRLFETKTDSTMIGIKPKGQPQATPYKYYATGGNYCAEIYCPNKGEDAGKWKTEVISVYDAHQKNFVPQWKKEQPTAKLVMRLFINDMVAYEENTEVKFCRVKKIEGSMRTVYLRGHLIVQEKADTLSWGASANQLQLKKARKISVDILGRVKDPLKNKKISKPKEVLV